jgi:anthranilate/para-aminobenzoate synthase component I
MRGVLRSEIDEPLLAYLERVVFDVEATRAAIAEEHARRTTENSALLQDAEREVLRLESQLDRADGDYGAGKLDAEIYTRLRGQWEDERRAAEAEAERLRARADEVKEEAAALDVDDELAEMLAGVREAVAGTVAGAEGLEEVRTALKRVFSKVTLVRTPDGELVLVPTVATFDEIESWVQLTDGRTAVKPLPQTLALPQKQSVREPWTTTSTFSRRRISRTASSSSGCPPRS